MRKYERTFNKDTLFVYVTQALQDGQKIPIFLQMRNFEFY